MYVCVLGVGDRGEKERGIYCKELIHPIMEAGKPKIFRVGQQPGDPRKRGFCSPSPNATRLVAVQV